MPRQRTGNGGGRGPYDAPHRPRSELSVRRAEEPRAPRPDLHRLRVRFGSRRGNRLGHQHPPAAPLVGSSLIPRLVTFGAETFKAGVELSGPEFWQRMTAPDAPFPTTAA